MPVASALIGAHRDGIVLASNTLEPELPQLLGLSLEVKSFPLTSGYRQTHKLASFRSPGPGPREPSTRNHVNNVINNERGRLKPQGFFYHQI